MFRPARGRGRAGNAARLSAVSIVAVLALPGAVSASPAPGAAVASRVLKVGTRQLGLGTRRAGTYFGSASSTIVNTSNQPVRINQIAFHDGDASDFVAGTDCFAHGRPSMLAPKAACVVKAIFTPHGVRRAQRNAGNQRFRLRDARSR